MGHTRERITVSQQRDSSPGGSDPWSDPARSLETREGGTLPGRTELFHLVDDPGETTNLADVHRDIAQDLEARLIDYARQMRPAEWIRAQPSFLGAQGETVFDPDFDIDDCGLPHEKAVLPQG